MPASNRDIQALAMSVGVVLPPSYFEFLDSLPARPKLFEADDGPRFRFRKKEWSAHSREQLFEPIQLDRLTSKPAAHVCGAHAELLSRWTKRTGENFTVVLTERGWTVERLARGFSFGEDDNGDPLFVDSQTGGVFIYYHDGMDVERWATSLDEILLKSKEVVLTPKQKAEMQALLSQQEQPTEANPACPQCGKPLASAKAQQCFKCGADWH